MRVTIADVARAAGVGKSAVSRVINNKGEVGDDTADRVRRVVNAVFAHDDLSAAGAPRALRDAGLRVPEDVSVIGFDDILVARHTEPPLTTVRQPMREMGEAAARKLLAALDGAEPGPDPLVIPTELVVRGSAPMP